MVWYCFVSKLYIGLDFVFNEQLAFIAFWVITRCFVIGVRYGLMSKYRFSILKKKELTYEEVDEDLLFPKWGKIEPAYLDKELRASFFRLGLRADEKSSFRFTFLKPLNSYFENNLDRVDDTSVKEPAQDVHSFIKAEHKKEHEKWENISQDSYDTQYDTTEINQDLTKESLD